MPFDPDAFLAATTPAPAVQGPGGFDPDAFLRNPLPVGPEPEGPGSLESLGRGALQGITLGFSDEITGALESLFSSKTYAQARDESRAANKQAAENHPWLYGGGELAGGIGSAFIPGLNVAKGASIAKAALTAGKAGAAMGLGTSEHDLVGPNQDFMGAIADTVHGAISGATTGAVLHGIGSKIAQGAEQRFEQGAIQDAMGRARPKDYLQVQHMVEANPAETKAILHSEDFAPVQKALRSGNTEKARTALDEYIEKVGSNREQDWKALDKALPKAGVESGKIVDRFENDIQRLGFQHGTADEVKVLTAVKDRLQKTWSTLPKSQAVSMLERQGLKAAAEELAAKEGTTVTGQDVFKAAEKATAVDGVVPQPVRDLISVMPFKFDPKSRVPGLELRTALTKAQDEAVASLGTIAETEHARLRAAPKRVFDEAMQDFLGKSKTVSPEAEQLVAKIEDRNRKLNLALSFKEGLEQKAKKELVGSQGLTHGLQSQAGMVLKGLGIGSLLHGNFGTAAAEIAAPYAMKAGQTALRRGNDTLARIMYAAKQGNPWAQRQLAALRATPQGLARLAAVQKPAGTEEEPSKLDQAIETVKSNIGQL